MDAKGLIDAATYCEEVFGHVEEMSNDAGAVMPLVRHILSTVRPDDDEPVTREWFCRNGNFPEQEDRENECLRVFIHNTGTQFIYADRHKGQWSVMIGSICLVKNPTVGELLALLRGLRVPFNK